MKYRWLMRPVLSRKLTSNLNSSTCAHFATSATVYASDSLSHVYRSVMTTVVSNPMIITSGTVDNPRGLTLSSVTSLSVKPKPLITFNIQTPSHASHSLHTSDIFAVHAMPATSQSSHVLKAFAGMMGKDTNPFELFKSLVSYDKNHSVPILSCSTFALLCRQHQVQQIQDHELWIAEVIGVIVNDSVSKSAIMYIDHKFRSVGDELKIESLENLINRGEQ